MFVYFSLNCSLTSRFGFKVDRPTPAKTDQDRPTPAKTGPHRPRPAHSGQDRPTPAKTGPHRPRPAHTGQDQPTQAKTGRHQPIPAKTGQHRPTAPEDAKLGKKSQRKQKSSLHSLPEERQRKSFFNSPAQNSKLPQSRHRLWRSSRSIWNLHSLSHLSHSKREVLWGWSGCPSKTPWLLQGLRPSVFAILSIFMQLHDLQDCKVRLTSVQVKSSSLRLQQEETRTSKLIQRTSSTEAVPEMPVNSSQRKTSFLHLDNFGKELVKEFSRGCWKSCHLSHQKQEAFTGRNSSFEPAEWATFSSCPRNLNFSTRTSSSHGFYSCPDWHSKPNQSFQQQGSSAGFLFEHRRSKSQSWKEFSTELCRARQDPGEVLHLDERSADEKRRFHWSRCGVLPKPGRVGLVHPWPAQTCSSRVSHQNQPWRWWKLFQGLSSSCQPIQFLTWGEAWRVPQHWCEEDLHHCHRGRHQWNVLQHLPDPGSHQN